MITLGVDPSLTGFGWCVHNSSVVGKDRVVAKGVFETSSQKIFVWRYMYLRQAIGEVLDAYPEIEGVGVESPPFGEQWSEGLYALFMYVNEAVFVRRKNVVYFDPIRVKNLARLDPSIRRGTMDKSDMIEAARVETGIKRWNHNEADAYVIARSAARFWDFFFERITYDELTPSEQVTFLKVHTFKSGKRKGETVRTGLVCKEDDRFFQFNLVDPQDIAVNVNFKRT